MLRTFMISTAIGALMIGSAAAQTSNPPAKMAQPSANTGEKVVQTQAPDQWLASKFTGTDVIGSNNEKIGDVNDVLFDKNGQVVAYVVGVGGFLGIGEKDVALAPSSFQTITQDNETKLRLSMTKDELKQAAKFETRDTRVTTGAAPSAPSNSTMKPSDPTMKK